MRDAPLPFTLRQLQYVVAVADLRSFRRAAERCHVGQPSLSAQIAEVEEQLKVLIFERDPRGVLVTPAGEALVARARAVLLAADELRAEAVRASDPFASTLRLGVIPTIAPYLLPRAAPALRSAHPGLTVLWSEHTTAELVRRVSRGELEGALVAREADLGGLDGADLGTDPFVFAACPAHPLAREDGPLDLTRLDGERLLLLDEGHCLRDQVRGFCDRVAPDEMAFRATSLATLAQVVAAGHGITLLPRIAVEAETRAASLATRPLADPAVVRTLALVWRPGGAVTGVLRAVARTLAPLVAAP